MKYLVFVGLSLTFIGAQCETPHGLTRSCTGSTPQTVYYSVGGSCGSGLLSVSVGSSSSCTLGVIEQNGVGLPTVGSFGTAAGAEGYDLGKGNWNLTDPSIGSMNVGTFLDCTGSAANSAGDIVLSCEENVCAVGDSDDVQCQTGTSCTAHLSPSSPDAGLSTPDATASNDDAGATKDAGIAP